jgi:PDZ domain-containing protein
MSNIPPPPFAPVPPFTQPPAAGALRPEDRLPEGPPARSRRLRWPLIALLVLVVAAAVASRVQLDEYAVTPGTAQSVQQFITVPQDRAHPVRHPVLLTDVEIARVTALSWAWFHLQSDAAFEPVVSVTGGTAPGELVAQGNQEMSQAEADAKTAALRRLGYSVGQASVGAVVTGTWTGTPAYAALNIGDVITAVDGVRVTTAQELTAALSGKRPGTTVTMTVLRQGRPPAASVPVTLRPTRVVSGEDAAGRPVYATVDLGVEVEDQIVYRYPFPVHIDVADIGGPSAGLAMILGVMDALTSGSITGGHTVAATGTIDADGNVGDVGGVAQKTVAVERAGATLFLVPPQEYRAALSKDTPRLKVVAVSTLDQALAVLAAHGGHVPPAVPASTTTTTVPAAP